MKITNIVWVVKKIRHLIEAVIASRVIIVYTNHVATVDIVRQSSINTTSTKKLNLRLIRASKYLQRFRLEIRHKPDKTNVIPDALSRLASRSYRAETNKFILNTVEDFLVSVITVSEAFRRRLLDDYQEPR